MLPLDITVVDVALPEIERELKAGFEDLPWVVDAYALTLAARLLTAGFPAGRFGRRLQRHPRGGRGRRFCRRSCWCARGQPRVSRRQRPNSRRLWLLRRSRSGPPGANAAKGVTSAGAPASIHAAPWARIAASAIR